MWRTSMYAMAVGWPQFLRFFFSICQATTIQKKNGKCNQLSCVHKKKFHFLLTPHMHTITTQSRNHFGTGRYHSDNHAALYSSIERTEMKNHSFENRSRYTHRTRLIFPVFLVEWRSVRVNRHTQFSRFAV